VEYKLLSGRRVLVIEDEMLILMMIEGMLADLGCESVTSAATIDRAIALIDGQVFDAAMLDMNLNGNNSRAIADALTARCSVCLFHRQQRSRYLGRLQRPCRSREIVQQ
jgi:CheY-like chemotaxis protein